MPPPIVILASGLIPVSYFVILVFLGYDGPMPEHGDSAAIYAPWRMDYIRSLSKPGGASCFLCEAIAAAGEKERRDRLVLWSTPHTIVLMNRYPYTNGHLLVAPRAHKPELEAFTSEEQLDLVQQTTRAVALLKRAVSAQGFNIGINIGRCAGAGLPVHLHQHVVPRWAGDVNFMHVVGEVSVIPEAMSQLHSELVRVMDEKMKRGSET
jgi:ATP adenylyltransferase